MNGLMIKSFFYFVLFSAVVVDWFAEVKIVARMVW